MTMPALPPDLPGRAAAASRFGREAMHLVHDAIAEQARGTPDAVAVVAAGGTLTCGELERRSRALARRLRDHGAGPEVPIGVCARRSLEVVPAVIGILRAGAAYVPLDPGYPPARVALMIADAGVQTVLVEPGTRVALPPHVRVIPLAPEVFSGDGPLDVTVLPDNLAYVMYTSGSTGVPKGVMITHAAMRNTLAWMQDAYPLCARDVVAHKTSISFTDSIWELLWPPLAGARLAVIDDHDARFPRLLLGRLRHHGVAVTQFVPAQMRLFLDEADRAGDPDPLPKLRWVFNGGEALPPSLARDWFRRFPRTRIANAYGMTESAIYGTNFVVEPADGEPVVLVGHPIANERAYVVDRDGQPCPPLCPGEIHLAGESLARGYLGRPDLTATHFVPDPWGPPGSRMYRTGDLGRRLATGELSCLGRLDRQVKVHGGRVELGEVEAALARHPAVRQAVVTARRDGADHQLTAYYTWRDADPGARELHRFLSSSLPSFMVPARLVAVASFPLTVNGKIDRDRLERDEVAHN
jgi:amino acid adenylation domain-containing protein